MISTDYHTRSLFGRAVYWGLQPLLLALVIGLWLWQPTWDLLFPVVFLAVLSILGVLEHTRPARPHWRTSMGEKGAQLLLVLCLVVLTGVVSALYDAYAVAPLAAWRAETGLDIWPSGWPLLVQLLLAFFTSELIWYGLHRAEHRWHFFWRASGHGAHHSFKRLGALNSGLNHPLELFVLALPAAAMEVLFGIGPVAFGVTLLILTQATLAHTNLVLNSKGIGWLFTTNRYHIHHHSAVLDESNTNYGCAAIVWDRVFGTFVDADTLDAGTGPTEPTLWQKFIMPLKEPGDTTIAP